MGPEGAVRQINPRTAFHRYQPPSQSGISIITCSSPGG